MSIKVTTFDPGMSDEQAAYWLYRTTDENTDWDERVSLMRGLETLYGGHEQLRTKAEELAKKYGKKEEADPFTDMWEV